MDYYAVGQRIRKIRKAKRLSQENLAQSVDISPTHMCHIENGNTKLSLQVLVDIANTLTVPTDLLIHGSERNRKYGSYIGKIVALLEDCTDSEIQIIFDTIVALKESLKQNRK